MAAAGFDRPRPRGKPDRRHFRRVLDTLKILQLDFVNVLVPAHYLVLWSRLGAYDIDRFQRFIYGTGEFTEHWAHEACIVPADYWPVLAYRRETYRPWKQSPVRLLDDGETYLEHLLERIREEGPLTASAFDSPLSLKRKAGDWHRSLPRHALEVHFGHGRLSVQGRLPSYQRVYDLPSRVLPSHHDLPELLSAEAHRRLLADAGSALGVATAADLADYFRMSPRKAAPHIEELVEAGELTLISVDGWAGPAFLSRHARLPRSIPGASLVSPFDPIAWYRPRAERLFDFRYRIEIYVPAAKREWGYYVLPFRLGDRLAGRLDLKADRKASSLLVQHAYAEPGTDALTVAEAMAAELSALGDWLGLDRIVVTRHNAFSKSLARAVAAAARS